MNWTSTALLLVGYEPKIPLKRSNGKHQNECEGPKSQKIFQVKMKVKVDSAIFFTIQVFKALAII